MATALENGEQEAHGVQKPGKTLNVARVLQRSLSSSASGQVFSFVVIMSDSVCV